MRPSKDYNVVNEMGYHFLVRIIAKIMSFQGMESGCWDHSDAGVPDVSVHLMRRIPIRMNLAASDMVARLDALIGPVP
jgi:hypothetical protein